MISNKLQSEVVKRKNINIFKVLKTILDWSMKDWAAAQGRHTLYYGVSIHLWGFNQGIPHKFSNKISIWAGLSIIIYH